ncbi:biosynthetic-type acetolactate synthase large subunit [candidate division KSB1 bacterium]|nr:biosynthetic-type acetolactate synthase large subunit [candidate division KSB1 bacterium]
MDRTGAQVVVEVLKKEGVRAVFGFPGGSVLDIFDEFYKANIPFYLTRHEQGAVHAADGFARASGEVGVCIATSGPGGTNLVTGLATAHMDSIPIVALTGQVPTQLIGNDAFQEADITGITRPVTKHNYIVQNTNDLPRILKEAFYIARTGRPGPVLVDIPKDIQQIKTSLPYPEAVEIRGYKPTLIGHKNQIQKLATAIKRSKKPIIYAGGGVIASGASAELTELARRLKIPVTTTLMGLGVFPETDELALKMLGMHGTQYANKAIMEADLIIAIGARFDDRITGKVDAFAPTAHIAHIDIDPSTIRKNVKVDIPVVGDVKHVLRELLNYIEIGEHGSWIEQVAKWKAELPLSYSQNGGLKPQYVVEQIDEITRGEAIITTEVGQNQMWAAQFYKYTHPRTFLSSGGLGTMGYGFPAAIGAQIACPDKIVFDIAGDGSIQMNIQELATAVTYCLPVKIAILNNHYLGMVRQWQEMFYGRRYSSTCLTRRKNCPPECDQPGEHCPEFIPDFIKVADAYGAKGIRVTESSQVRPALQEALDTEGPVVLEFLVEKEENVYPMVPAGASLNQMIRGMA